MTSRTSRVMGNNEQRHSSNKRTRATTTTMRTSAAAIEHANELKQSHLKQQESRQEMPSQQLFSTRLTSGREDFDINDKGYPFLYSCDQHLLGARPEKLRVRFDYEIVLDSTNQGFSSFVQDHLPGLEFALLWSVADKLHLHSCDLPDSVVEAALEQPLQQSSSRSGSTDVSGGERRRLLRQPPRKMQSNNSIDSSNDDSFTIVSLSSIRDDFRDIQLAECEFLGGGNSLEETETCFPMYGFMTAEYTTRHTGTSMEATVEQYLLQLIEDAMNAQYAKVGPVDNMLFVGDRQQFRDRISSIIRSPEADGDGGGASSPFAGRVTGSRGTAIGLLAGFSVVAAVTFLIIGLLFRRRRQQKSAVLRQTSVEQDLAADKHDESSDNEDDFDVEVSSSPCNNNSKDGASKESKESESSDMACVTPDVFLNHDNPSDAAVAIGAEERADDVEADITTPVVAAAAAAAPEEESPVPITAPTEATAASTDTIPSECASSSSETTAPPAAPESEVASTATDQPRPKETLKKHRKKKKKKKPKAALVRVNSRENIKEMETISEADGESERSDDETDDEEECDNDTTEGADGSGSTNAGKDAADDQAFVVSGVLSTSRTDSISWSSDDDASGNSTIASSNSLGTGMFPRPRPDSTTPVSTPPSSPPHRPAPVTANAASKSPPKSSPPRLQMQPVKRKKPLLPPAYPQEF